MHWEFQLNSFVSIQWLNISLPQNAKFYIKFVDKSTKCAKILGLGQNKVSFTIIISVEFLHIDHPRFRGVVVIASAYSTEGPRFNPRPMPIFYLHSYSAAKKVQNQICPWRISQVHQKYVFTLPLQQKKYKIKFPQEDCQMYIKTASSLFLCSKKSTKSNLPRMNITCTSKICLHSSSAAKTV